MNLMNPTQIVSETVPSFLQYGALGLLAVVLIGVGAGGYHLMTGLLTELRALSAVIRDAGQAAAAHFARSEKQIDTLTERQESTQEAIERLERANNDGHRATQTQLLMISRRPSPYPMVPRGGE